MRDITLTNVEKTVLEELRDVLESFLGSQLVMLVLYGSKARGDWDPESDLDVAIVVAGLTRELKHKILDTVAEIEFKHVMPLSTLVLSEEDFHRLRERERRIALDIEKDGISL